MKNLEVVEQQISLYFSILFLFSCPIAHAQWTFIGNPEFSGQSMVTSVSMDVWQGIPYMAYRDHAIQNKGTVMKYDGTNWVPLGAPGFTPGAASGFSLKMNDSIPYVAFIDTFTVNNEMGKLTVMKYESEAWSYVGTPGFSPGIVRSKPALAIDGGIPYVAFREYGRVLVMLFDGSNWVQVGPEIATYARDLSLAVYNGIPYIAYQNASIYYSIVKKFDGTNWVNVGDTGFDGHAYSTMNFALSEGGTPYLCHSNPYTNGYGGILKFDGNVWVNIEAPNVNPTQTDYRPIAFDGEIPYVVFQYPYPGLTVMRYKNAALEMVGSVVTVADVSAFESSPDYVNIVIENGVPYLGFQHDAFGGGATAMKYTEPSSSTDLYSEKTGFRLYPNPSHGGEITFFLESKETCEAFFQVFDLQGKRITEQNLALVAGKGAYLVYLPDLPAGVYITKVTTPGYQIASDKLIILD